MTKYTQKNAELLLLLFIIIIIIIIIKSDNCHAVEYKLENLTKKKRKIKRKTQTTLCSMVWILVSFLADEGVDDGGFGALIISAL